MKEAIREQETFRYGYSLISRSAHNDPAHPIPQHALLPCSDPGLTALAQLGTFKLNATRGIISLFDSQRQHVVAEATPGLPLDPTVELHQSQLWLCGTSIMRADSSPCSTVLARAGNTADAVGAGHRLLPVLAVPCLSRDDQFSWSAYIHEAPFGGFYAGVPIRTGRGLNIGVFCVFDHKHRPGLDDYGTNALRDISSAIMAHLESTAAAGDFRRADRMVRGLGCFVEGSATLSSDFRSFATRSAHSRTDDPTSPPYPTDYFSTHTQPDQSGVKTSSRMSMSPPSPASTMNSPLLVTATPNEAFPAIIIASDVHMAEVRQIFSRASNVIRESVEVEGVLFLDAGISSFGGLVGHSIDQEGDSSSSSRSRSRSRSRPHPRSRSRSHSRSSRSGKAVPSSRHRAASSRTPCPVLGFSTPEASSINGGAIPPDHDVISEPFLRRLLRRYSKGKIFNYDEDGAYMSVDSERDEPAGTSSPKRKKRRRRTGGSTIGRGDRGRQRIGEADQIIAVFEGARSVALVPLWDSHKDRWFSGAFVWTNTVGRTFTVEGELSYLAAFGTTIMAEVFRVGAVLSDKAKSDVLGCLSHELRSPLHGVIAGVELLQESEMNAFQADVLQTIETSGRTLLDTLDHLLYYSKINSFLRPSATLPGQKAGDESPARIGHKSGPISIESGMMTLISDARVDILAEEVVESLFAGYNYQHRSVAHLEASAGLPGPDSAGHIAMKRLDSLMAIESFDHVADSQQSFQPFQNAVVPVYLDIDPNVSWGFRTQPGAIRRIIMNIFGNALKYTTQGYIWISLRQDPIAVKFPARASRVILTVSDSGKGIGKEYLTNHLFTPFSQEDTLAPGTGLGLSLVRQIATILGGSITVTSKAGKGTTVRFSIPMTHSPCLANPEPDFKDRIDKLRGLRIGLRGFGSQYERVGGDSYFEGSAQVSEHALMADLCGVWLGMEIMPDQRPGAPGQPGQLGRPGRPTEEAPLPDLFLYSEFAFRALGSAKIRPIPKCLAPAVVICQDAVTAYGLVHSDTTPGIFEFIWQPAGPRKLAKSLVLALSRRSEAQAFNVSPAPQSQNETAASGMSPGVEGATCSPIQVLEPSSVKLVSTKTCVGTEPEPCIEKRASSPPVGGSLEKPDQPNQPNQPAGEEKTGGVLLLVDDNSINLRILSAFAKKLRYDYDIAVNGLKALCAYTKNPARYRCIFMDISMPVMDGIEATRKMREFERTNHIRPATIIALTGLASSSIQQEAFASGINLLLTKPVKLKELELLLGSLGDYTAAR